MNLDNPIEDLEEIKDTILSIYKVIRLFDSGWLAYYKLEYNGWKLV